jgi:hypothetical protein
MAIWYILKPFWYIFQVFAIWSISLPFGILYGHLFYFEAIWVYFSSFGLLYQEKFGNPAN